MVQQNAGSVSHTFAFSNPVTLMFDLLIHNKITKALLRTSNIHVPSLKSNMIRGLHRQTNKQKVICIIKQANVQNARWDICCQ